MGILGSVIVGTVTHTATGTAVGSLYHLFNGSLQEARANWQVSGLFCSIVTNNTTAAFQYQFELGITVGRRNRQRRIWNRLHTERGRIVGYLDAVREADSLVRR
jgi:hypothetical protein